MQTIVFDNGRAEVFSSHAFVFTITTSPVVIYRTEEGRWMPFKAEYGEDHRQVTALGISEVAARCGATESFLRQIEVAAGRLRSDSLAATAAGVEAGRRAWEALTDDERAAMNDYATKTEGHTID